MPETSLPQKYPQDPNPNTYIHIFDCTGWQQMTPAIRTAVGLFATQYSHTPLACYLNPEHEGTKSDLFIVYDAQIPAWHVAFDVPVVPMK